MTGIREILEQVGIQRRDNGNFTQSSSVNNACPICDGKGYIVERQDGTLFATKCACKIREANRRRIERSGLAPLLENCRLDTFQTPERWQQEAKEAASSYFADWRGKWFFIGGSVGAGKTHLCTALCGMMMEAGIDLRFFQWRSDAPRIKALVNDPDRYTEELDALKKIRALYIDDFLKGTPTEADRNLSFEVLNARYNLPETVTIISSEKTIEDILNWDEAIGSRIYERSRGYYVKISGPGKNWRLRA